MQLILIHDMRTPAFGAPAADLYAAALDQCEWADGLGFDLVGLGEHHGSEDGYLPSPLVMAAAVASRTRRVRIRPSVLLAPFYHPLRLAEDLAVLDRVSGGRILVGIGAGYRASEFAMFGERLQDRAKRVVETVEVLEHAWTGEPFVFRGRTVRVTPRPLQRPRPPILLGGASKAAACRAARIADGWIPPVPELWAPYRDECRRLGRDDPGPWPSTGPIFLHVTRDPGAAWRRLTPHVLHQVNSYGAWTAEAMGRAAGPYVPTGDVGDIRQGGAYQVLPPEETLALAESLGPDGILHLHPLLAGLEPAFAWKSLRLFEEEVLPYLPGRGSAPGTGT